MYSAEQPLTRREILFTVGAFFAAALFFVSASVWSSSIGNEIVATTHLKATSTVQATGNIIGYADLLIGGTTTAAAGVDVAFGGAAGTHADVYVSGGLGVGNATTSDGDFIVGNDFQVTSNGRALVGATTTAGSTGTFVVHGGSAVVSSGGTGTSTLSVINQAAANGTNACIELSTDGTIYRIFVNAARNGLTVEAGTCQNN